jgi:hypothetical protein
LCSSDQNIVTSTNSTDDVAANQKAEQSIITLATATGGVISLILLFTGIGSTTYNNNTLTCIVLLGKYYMYRKQQTESLEANVIEAAKPHKPVQLDDEDE